ncbi:MAG: adenine deaminase [Candidatus Hydrogenedentota bacterium]
MVTLETRIRRSRGEEPVDLLLKNIQLINVLSYEIYPTSIAISNTRVVGFGDYEAKEIIDCDGLYAAPGFIDGHMHIESSMVSVREFAKAVVPRGTTTVVADPHEIANVLGIDGIRYILESSKYNPLTVYLMLPSCVPATDKETSGSQLRAFDLMPFLNEKWVLGIGEMMNFPGVINTVPDVIDKIKSAGSKRIDGHCPGLKGKDLYAYISAGIYSDHECITREEAKEKLRAGMYIMIREGSASKNLDEIINIVTKENARRCFFVTDDRHPGDLINEGHIDFIVRKSINKGIDPLLVFQMASLNAACYFQKQDIGAIAPGYRADIIIFEDLKKIDIKYVLKYGRVVAERGKLLPLETPTIDVRLRGSINIKWLENDDFIMKARGNRIRVIDIVPDQIFTNQFITEPRIIDNRLESDTENDILKLIVLERHLGSNNIGKGFVRGFGLKRGAIASSVSHDSHNIVVVGTNDRDIFKAITAIRKYQGGISVVENETLKGVLPLPIAGLMSNKSLYEVDENLKQMNSLAKEMGVKLRDPFMHLSFLSLPVIPELKLTDKGLFDVKKFDFVDLFVN